MNQEDLQARYENLMKVVLLEGQTEFLPAVRQLGRELFAAKLTPADAVQMHTRAIRRVGERRWPHVALPRPADLGLLLELLVGWGEEAQTATAQLRSTLEFRENTLRMMQGVAEDRLAQLILGNQLLDREIRERRRVEKRLRRARLWLSRAQRTAGLGFWIWHFPAGKFRIWGLFSFTRTFGVNAKTVTRPEEFLSWVHKEDRPKVEAAFAQIRTGETPEELEFRLGEAQPIYVKQEVVVRRKKHQAGGVAFGVLVDLTRIKEAESAVRRAQRIAAIGSFAAGIAHEINNPLGSALLAAETALALLKDPQQLLTVEQCLRNILEAIERCGRVVHGLLAFARQQPAEREICDLNAIITRASEIVHGFLEQRQATLRTELCAQPLEVLASPLELELALVNLLRNAIESRPQGAEVVVRTTSRGSWAVVQIEDNGPGLTPEQREHMFDPFYTTRTREGGTGLGATVAYAIVEQHGGRIEVQSWVGIGTRVEIWLPLRPAQEG